MAPRVFWLARHHPPGVVGTTTGTADEGGEVDVTLFPSLFPGPWVLTVEPPTYDLARPAGMGFGWRCEVQCASKAEADNLETVAGHGGEWRRAFRGVLAPRHRDALTSVRVEWAPHPPGATEADALQVFEALIREAERRG